MTVKELLKRVRHRLDDGIGGVTSDTLWNDWELIDDYANQALRRMFLVVRNMTVDATTATDLSLFPLCRIPVVAGISTYLMSPKIIRIARFKLASQQYPIDHRSVAELDREQPGWDGSSSVAGAPTVYCTDLSNNSVTLVPTPVANDTASLQVYRFPLATMSYTDTAELDFREEYHNDLIPGICAIAFGKHDTEAKNAQLSVMYTNQFNSRLEEIKLELIRKNATVHTNRP